MMSVLHISEDKHRYRIINSLIAVMGSPWRLTLFMLVTVAVSMLYTVLLPFAYTQRVELANWDYLTLGMLIWAVLLGIGMSLVVSIQIYAMRKIVVRRAAAGSLSGAALVASLLPSFLCCTPVIPTLLAFIGVGGMSLYDTTGALQHFFATNQTWFLGGSAALLVLSIWWGLHRITTADCLTGADCSLDIDDMDEQAVSNTMESNNDTVTTGFKG